MMSTIITSIMLCIMITGFSAADDPDEVEDITCDWGSIYYLTGPEEGEIYHARIYATDSILHIYADHGSSPHLYHYNSIDNGDSWSLLADEVNPDFWITAGPVMSYFGHDKMYTIYEGVRNNYPYWEGFTYFRGSADYGETWPWSSELRIPIDVAARACNISGNGDTLFVVSYQDTLELWRSYDAGYNWQHLNTPCNGGYHTSGLEYDKSKGILHVAFLGNDWDIYYVRSLDQGDTWDEVNLIGFSEDGPSNLPAMESDGLGNVAITWEDWHEHPMGPAGTYIRISHDEGVTWLPAIRIGENHNTWSDVTIQGSYVGVLWAQIGQLLYRESFDGGNTWETTTVVATGKFLYGSLIRINGTIHVAFRQFYQYGPNTWGDRAGYIRYDPLTAVSYESNNLAPVRILLSCFPNPFNIATKIQYSLSEPSDITIEIYDLLGRIVKTLVDEEKQAGQHQAIWKAKHFSSGIYFYRIQAGDHSETKKMVLLK